MATSRKKRLSILYGITTVGERGQIVIPQNIRTALGIDGGDSMVVFERGGKIIVIPAGQLEGHFTTILDDIEQIRKSLKKK